MAPVAKRKIDANLNHYLGLNSLTVNMTGLVYHKNDNTMTQLDAPNPRLAQKEVNHLGVL